MPLSTRLPEERPLLAKSDTHGREFYCNFDRLAHGPGADSAEASLPPPYRLGASTPTARRRRRFVPRTQFSQISTLGLPRHGAEPFTRFPAFQQQLTFNSGAVRAGKTLRRKFKFIHALGHWGKRLDDELLGSKAGQIQGPSSVVAMAFLPCLGAWCFCTLQTADCRLRTASRTRCSYTGDGKLQGSQGLVPRASPPPFPDPGSQSPRLPVSQTVTSCFTHPHAAGQLHPSRLLAGGPASTTSHGPMSRLATGGPHAALLSSHLRSVWCLARSLIHAANVFDLF
jgi:hypothetical protein